MFQFCTALGMFVVPLGYLAVWEMTKSIEAATFSAIFILAGMLIIKSPSWGVHYGNSHGVLSKTFG